MVLLTFAASLVGGGDGLALVTCGLLQVTGALVGDAICAAHLPAGGRARRAALSASDAVWTQVLVEQAMFSGRT